MDEYIAGAPLQRRCRCSDVLWHVNICKRVLYPHFIVALIFGAKGATSMHSIELRTNANWNLDGTKWILQNPGPPMFNPPFGRTTKSRDIFHLFYISFCTSCNLHSVAICQRYLLYSDISSHCTAFTSFNIVMDIAFGTKSRKHAITGHLGHEIA